MLQLVLLAVPVVASAAPEAPALCVDAQAAPAIAEPDLVEALRARVARPEVRVVPCASLGEALPTWRLLVEQVDPERVALTLTGQELWARRMVAAGALNREELAQQIALTAAEVARPSIEHTLARLGQAPAPDDLVAEIEEQAPCPPPEPCPEPEVREVRPPHELELRLRGGPLLGLPDLDFAGYAELQGALAIGALELGLHLGGRNVLGPDLAAATVAGAEIELGLDALWRWQILRAGLRAQSRLAVLEFTPREAAGEAGTRMFWRGGFGGLVELLMWRGEFWSLSLAAQLWLWPQPNRFLAEGQPIYAQPHVEMAIGIGVGLGPFYIE